MARDLEGGDLMDNIDARLASRIGALMLERWILEMQLEDALAKIAKLEEGSKSLDEHADADLAAVDGHLES